MKLKRMRRRASLVLALFLSFNLCVPAFAKTQTFTDVPVSHWAYSSIEQAAQAGAVDGVGGGKYAPGRTLTMAEFLVIMTRAFYGDEVGAASETGSWYVQNLEVALAHGLLDATAYALEGEHRLFEPCSRYDMASILYHIICDREIAPYCRYDADAEEVERIGAQIADFAAIPENQKIPVAALVAAEVIQGVDAEGNFAGTLTVDRAQAATIYCRFAKIVAEKEETDAYIAEVVALVNAEREKEGLSALNGSNAKLNAAAAVRAAEIVESFSHTRPDGRSCFTALAESGVSYGWAGENIAAGQRTPAAVVNAWMNSPGHRANILNEHFAQTGVGCVYGNGAYGIYWVQMFVD